jgi:hypothetical protein
MNEVERTTELSEACATFRQSLLVAKSRVDLPPSPRAFHLQSDVEREDVASWADLSRSVRWPAKSAWPERPLDHDVRRRERAAGVYA